MLNENNVTQFYLSMFQTDVLPQMLFMEWSILDEGRCACEFRRAQWFQGQAPT